jgi:polyphenol oxidase
MLAPCLLHSDVLAACGVPHAFSTRVGGVSKGIFESLNFGNPGDLPPGEKDPPDTIARNWALLKETLDAACATSGCATRTVLHVHQVHGRDVDVVPRAREWLDRPQADPKADAIVTDDPRVLVSVRLADCAPILLASADGAIVAAVHAGWRGVVAGVAPAAIASMHALGARDIRAAIGPCISIDALEVGDEVVAEFNVVFGDRPDIIVRREWPKPHIDIKQALVVQLREAGVHEIDVSPVCTVREARAGGLCFSHRGHAGRTGRMVGVIGPRSR